MDVHQTTPTKLQPALHSLDKDFTYMGHLVSWRSIQKQLLPFSMATSQETAARFLYLNLWWWWQQNTGNRHNLQLAHIFEEVERALVNVNKEDLDNTNTSVTFTLDEVCTGLLGSPSMRLTLKVALSIFRWAASVRSKHMRIITFTTAKGTCNSCYKFDTAMVDIQVRNTCSTIIFTWDKISEGELGWCGNNYQQSDKMDVHLQSCRLHHTV